MKRQLILILLLFLGIIIRTTILYYLPFNISPDLSLIILVYFSFRYGSRVSQISGFASGLLEDFLSLSPLGFNCFVRTVIASVTGLFHERLVMDPILFPVMSVVGVTLFKGILFFILVELFNIPISTVHVFSTSFFLEIVINALLAPVLFQLIRILLDKLLPERKAL